MSYQKSSTSDEDDTVVPLGTTLLPPTMSYCSKRRMAVAMLAGMMLAGGMVGRRPEVGSSSTPTAAAEGLVVATQLSVAEEDYDYDYGTTCVPAASGATFGGVSTTPDFDAVGQTAPFETCFQFGNEATYCWTTSYYWADDRFYPCYPTSRHGYPYYPNFPQQGPWKSVKNDDLPSVHPVTHPYSCGRPCHDQHLRPDSF